MNRQARLRAGVILAAALAALASPVRAEEPYPSRTVTIVLPLPPGGAADFQARLVAQNLQARLGQSFVVDSRPGAGGNLGAEAVARAAPDGYTLLCAPQGNFAVADLLYKSLNFDPRAFAPVSIISRYPTVILGRPDLPADDIAGLIAYARKNPGKLTYASQGSGQIGHLTLEMLKQMAGVDIVHVPYRGSAPALRDLMAGQVDVLADTLLASIEFLKAGKLKLLGIGGHARISTFPDVQTVGEVLPGFESETWMAIAAPPGTPPAITGKLSAEIGAIVHTPDIAARIVELQAVPDGGTPDEMAQVIRASTARWKPVIAKAGIKVE